MPEFIRVGDTTSHGGTVISGDNTFVVDGKPVARVGDMTVCRKCRGHFTIAPNASNTSAMGQNVARAGDKTACGAILIASQFFTTGINIAQGEGASDDSPKPALTEAGTPIAVEVPGICLECLKAAAKQAATFVVRGE